MPRKGYIYTLLAYIYQPTRIEMKGICFIKRRQVCWILFGGYQWCGRIQSGLRRKGGLVGLCVNIPRAIYALLAHIYQATRLEIIPIMLYNKNIDVFVSFFRVQGGVEHIQSGLRQQVGLAGLYVHIVL
jgi:hypothetical protein